MKPSEIESALQKYSDDWLDDVKVSVDDDPLAITISSTQKQCVDEWAYIADCFARFIEKSLDLKFVPQGPGELDEMAYGVTLVEARILKD